MSEIILERRKHLERILKTTAGIQPGSYVEAEGKALFKLTKEKGMEGIIAKRKDGIYRPGKRSSDWLKIKARLQRNSLLLGSRSQRKPKASGRGGARRVRPRETPALWLRWIRLQRKGIEGRC